MQLSQVFHLALSLRRPTQNSSCRPATAVANASFRCFARFCASMNRLISSWKSSVRSVAVIPGSARWRRLAMFVSLKNVSISIFNLALCLRGGLNRGSATSPTIQRVCGTAANRHAPRLASENPSYAPSPGGLEGAQSRCALCNRRPRTGTHNRRSELFRNAADRRSASGTSWAAAP
jgi:hypothetical protein